MTKLKKRRSEIIKTLSDMSRNWGLYTSGDWMPLERELHAINARL